jgi:hypothetical protein
MTQIRHSTPGTSPPRASNWLLITLAVVAVLAEVVAGNAAIGSFTLSTVYEDRAASAARYPMLLAGALILLLVAGAYWVMAQARLAAGFMAGAAVLAALGLWTWLFSPLLALAAIVLSFVRR